jgi:hypothetical protein
MTGCAKRAHQQDNDEKFKQFHRNLPALNLFRFAGRFAFDPSAGLQRQGQRLEIDLGDIFFNAFYHLRKNRYDRKTVGRLHQASSSLA